MACMGKQYTGETFSETENIHADLFTLIFFEFMYIFVAFLIPF